MLEGKRKKENDSNTKDNIEHPNNMYIFAKDSTQQQLNILKVRKRNWTGLMNLIAAIVQGRRCCSVGWMKNPSKVRGRRTGFRETRSLWSNRRLA